MKSGRYHKWFKREVQKTDTFIDQEY
jgi:hypothetical protein